MLNKLDTLKDEWTTDKRFVLERKIKAVIEAISNTASLDAYEKLWPVAQDKKLPPEVRFRAVVALKQLVPWKHHEVTHQEYWEFYCWSISK